ncbi:MAG: hypothetical protein LCH30_04740 [Proteobacteria bacterium]|nr:hypothetical protein [Pseudomonadota bacterium]
MIKLLPLILGLSLSINSYAERVDLEADYWRCLANDSENKQWITLSAYEITALNKALDNCKKESTSPGTCKINRDNCEYFSHGHSTKPMWRCTALDKKAKAWPSRVASHRDEAAVSAKEHCLTESSIPDTCYINLLTCRNLNARN